MRFLSIRWPLLTSALQYRQLNRRMSSNRLAFYRVRGTHYEYSRTIGMLTRDAIRERIEKDFSNLSTLFAFVQSDYGAKLHKGFQEAVQSYYPWYWDEIQGLADGSEIPFEQILVLNFLNETRTAYRLQEEKHRQSVENETGEKGCTTVLINRTDSDVCSILHNEDHATALYTTAYIIEADIQSSFYSDKQCYSPEEKFIAYSYAGSIPGNAFSANIHGFACTLNGLYPNFVAHGRLPRQILNRALLAVRNEDDLDNLLRTSPVAYGFCVNAGFAHQTNYLLNYEIGPNLKMDQENFISKCRIVAREDSLSKDDDECLIKFNYLLHYNHYERLNDVIVQQKALNSTYSRWRRGEELGEMVHIDDALSLLGDHENEAFPIFRVPNQTDVNSVTLCTVHFNFRTLEMFVYLHNPKDNPQPNIRYNLADLFLQT